MSAFVAVLLTSACSKSMLDERAPSLGSADGDRRLTPPPRAAQTIDGSQWWSMLGTTDEPTRAGAVTPLDEAPDSSWFTNRNAVRRLSPEAIHQGPAQHRAPRDGQRWTVTGLKQGGAALGLRAKDEAGGDFILKLDEYGHDEVETGADIVAQRLLYAAGYNVPENHIIYVTRDSIESDPALRDEIDAVLARAARDATGAYRVLASRLIDGTPLGGTASFGTRDDDPNDRVPHENRRDMRGLYTVAAWLSHVDVKATNTLEAWVPDPKDPSRGYVEHYLLDFGKSLGAMARINGRLYSGFAYNEDLQLLAISHMTTGARVPWADIGPFPSLRGLGWIESEHFDPAAWKAMYPWLPFTRADRFDKFWGARLVASFTPAQIRAALDAARYSEPRTVEYLARVLDERRRKVLEHWFREVAPLERFEVRRGSLCFVDLWLAHGLGGGAATYTAGNRRATASANGTVCFPKVPRSGVVAIRVDRPGHDVLATRVEIRDSRVTAIERH